MNYCGYFALSPCFHLSLRSERQGNPAGNTQPYEAGVQLQLRAQTGIFLNTGKLWCDKCAAYQTQSRSSAGFLTGPGYPGAKRCRAAVCSDDEQSLERSVAL